MNPKIDEIFLRACELPEEEVKAFLAEACGGDTELHQEVERKLETAQRADSFFGKADPDRSAAVNSEDDDGSAGEKGAFFPNPIIEPVSEQEGDGVGTYTLLRRIGEGGFGTVWMAEQREPISRIVALKVVKAGMDTREVLARFEAERQTLAMLDHPNIARVIDAGATASGRPYFAMELVEGIPITQYCAEKRLGTTERLRLFLDVCAAVNHAHQKGIIHRDLKPSNILVAVAEPAKPSGDRNTSEVPVPKVIDFGIAKATQQQLTEQTLFTRFEQLLGTPAYMSPEQAAMGGIDIDTRSDIYSLGVLLYELLSGAPPFDPKSLLSASYDEMRRIIQEEEPPRPSTKLSETQSGSHTDSASQNIAPGSLQGDLDWIVMKAIEKDRARRYETANAFAADIGRHLSDEPVLAVAPSVAYRFHKFARRNKAALAISAGGALLLTGAVLVSGWQAVRAGRAGTRAVENGKRASALAEDMRRQSYAADMLVAKIELDRLNYGAARQHMRRHVPASDQEDLRGFEWRLLWERSRGDQFRTLKGHTSTVTDIAFSPDRKHLLSSSIDQRVIVWDINTGMQVNSWVAHDAPVNSLSIAPDGSKLATGGGLLSVKLWGFPSGRLLHTIEDIGAVARFGPLGDHLFVGTRSYSRTKPTQPAPSTITHFDISDIAHPRRLAQFKVGFNTISATDPSNKWLAIGCSPDEVQIVDLVSGQILKTLPGTNGATSLTFSPNSTLLAVTFGVRAEQPENRIMIVDCATWQAAITLDLHGGRVNGVDFSPDGRLLASAGSDQTVRLWNVGTWKEHRRFHGHGGSVNTVAFSTDGSFLASGGEDILLWKTDRRTSNDQIDGAKVIHGGNWSPFFLNHETLFAAAVANGNSWHLGIWNVETGELLHEFQDEFACLGALEESNVFITLGKTILRWRDLDHFRVVHEVEIQEQPVPINQDVQVMHDRATVLYAQTGIAYERDLESGQIRNEFPLSGFDRPRIQMAPDRSGWAAIDWYTKSLRIGVNLDGRQVRELNGHRGEIFGIEFSPTESLFATASLDGTARLWEFPSGRHISTLTGHKGGLFDCAFSPDGRTLATASGDKTIKLWHFATGRELMTLHHQHPVTVCVFSPEGNYLASGTIDGTYRFWSAAKWDEIGEDIAKSPISPLLK